MMGKGVCRTLPQLTSMKGQATGRRVGMADDLCAEECIDHLTWPVLWSNLQFPLLDHLGDQIPQSAPHFIVKAVR